MRHVIFVFIVVILANTGLRAANPPTSRPTSGPATIAHFSFDHDANDDVENRAKADLKHASVKDGNLVLNGAYEFGGSFFNNGYRAVFGVPALDYGSFTVAWRFKADSFKGNRNCLIAGGTGYRWFTVQRRPSGKLHIDFNNHDVDFEVADTDLKTDVWMQIACSVDIAKRRVLVMLDGRKVADIELPKKFVINVIGTDTEKTDRQFTFTDYGNGETFDGQVDELSVFPQAMSEEELIALARPREDGDKGRK